MSDDKLPEIIPAPTGETTLLAIISRAASDPNTDVDKLERLMALYERHTKREAEMAYDAALADMQPELPEITEKGEILNKEKEVQSTYAKWEDINQVIKPVLTAHGFGLNFEISQNQGQIAVTAILHHKGGHSQRTTLSLPIDTSGSKNTVQAHGSSTSYGMRYTAIALLNISSRGRDDDGVAGGTRLISDADREVLEALAKDAGVDLEKFCTFLKVPSLDQLQARRFKYAENALTDRKARMEQASKVAKGGKQ